MRNNIKSSFLVGDRFGKLEIVEFYYQKIFYEKQNRTKTHKICKCKCDCGNSIEVKSESLKYDDKVNCGCEQKGCKTLCKPGEKYGQLTILESWTENNVNNKNRKDKFCKCKCDCGNIVNIKARYFRWGHKTSCGCLKYPQNNKHPAWKGCGELGLSMWSNLINNCNARKISPFSITIEYAWELFLKQERKCAISGVPIQFSKKSDDPKNKSASLDRIDSSQGYIVGNVQWVHKDVNLMKNIFKQEDFINWCKIIAQNNS